jgi:hypothetical protein
VEKNPATTAHRAVRLICREKIFIEVIASLSASPASGRAAILRCEKIHASAALHIDFH